MDSRDAGELSLLLLSVFIFVGYHFWLYYLQNTVLRRNKSKWFNVFETAGLTRLLWTHAMIADEKEAITGVQTLRNAIMVCAMLATASAYVGGRALPSILFDSAWRDTLNKIAGFLFKIPPTRHNTTGWHPEGEALALTHQAGICFSLALRFFYAFGLAALYIPGPTSLICSTVAIVVILFFTDNLPLYRYDDLLRKVGKMKTTSRSMIVGDVRSDL